MRARPPRASLRLPLLALSALGTCTLACRAPQTPAAAAPALTSDGPALISAHDGAHDFDFLIGDWKAHVRRLPERLVGSTTWVEYDGISNHKKLLDSNANFEQFEVDSPKA